MRVVPCFLVIAWLCVGTTGCSLFNKRPKEDTAKAGGREPAKFPSGGGNDPIRQSSATAAAYDTGALLAGSVIDEYNNHPKGAFVSWTPLDEPAKNEAPIDIEVSPEGYFTIRNLKASQHYKLTARAKEGGRNLVGVTYVKAPDIHVLIKLRSNASNVDTPPIPGPPAYTPKHDEPKKISAISGDRSGLVAGPGWNITPPASMTTPRPVVVPDLPATMSVPAPPAQPGAPPPSGAMTPPGATTQPGPFTQPPPATPPPSPVEPASAPSSEGWKPGIVSIPNPLQSAPVKIQPPVPAPAPAPSVGLPPTSARVPSCVLVGNRLINFALYDLNHQGWEYKTHRRGRLTLLDFWGTWCMPCKQTIPSLVALQSRYGTSGLEVIGIAYENGGTFTEQARRVGNQCQALQINYRVLLGGEGQCPVRNSFAIRFIPTLVLIDENGWILWRHEGRPDRAKIDDLEFLIKRQLGIRP